MIQFTHVRHSLLAVAAAAAAIITGAAASPRTPTQELKSALQALGPMGDCPTQCSWCQADENHRNDEHENSTNQGTVHGCQFTEGGCTDHACSITLAGLGVDDLNELEDIIRRVPAGDLKSMADPQGHLRINAERASVQVMGCASQVILNVALSADQASDLALMR
jgi:hypothetical protein